jgi:hypothetical protein
MLTKCFNPACSNPFRFLGEGRLFPIEFSPPAGAGGTSGVGSGRRKNECFWLCPHCSNILTIVVARGILPVLIPQKHPSPHGAELRRESGRDSG